MTTLADIPDRWSAERRLAAALVAAVPGLTLDHVVDALFRLDLDLVPRTATTGGDRVRAAATGQAVVIGRYSDGSSLSAACYGPYAAERAEAVAGLLNAGSWYGMEWLVMPLGVLPGGET